MIFFPFEAEALACLEAINWVIELDYQNVIMELDCKGVVNGGQGGL